MKFNNDLVNKFYYGDPYYHLVIDGPYAIEGSSYLTKENMDGEIENLHPSCVIEYQGQDYNEAKKILLSLMHNHSEEQKSNDVTMDDSNRITEIRAVVKTHTIKLNVLKENFSRSEEENWTVSEMHTCEKMIQTLASILSDLNKILA